MKHLLLFIAPLVLMTAACKKETITMPTPAPPEQHNTATAAKTPLTTGTENNTGAQQEATLLTPTMAATASIISMMKGNWRLVYFMGGITGNMHYTAAEWGHTLKLNLKPSMIYKSTMMA